MSVFNFPTLGGQVEGIEPADKAVLALVDADLDSNEPQDMASDRAMEATPAQRVTGE